MCILLALIIDWIFGEPPIAVHPVVWFGTYLKQAESLHKLSSKLFWGSLCFTIGAILVSVIAIGLQFSIAQFSPLAQILLTGIALKPAFALRMLIQEVTKIEIALQQDLEQGRQRLAYIVSRDTTNLSELEVRESALESISENLCDSVIAPLFWFLLLGLPGAYLYRFINTADAMWGYKNDRYEQWGKLAAKTDDLMNFVPARITGIWLLLFPGKQMRSASFFQLIQAAKQTPSPNSGWSMAAFALRLGVHLGKPGVYILNPKGQDVTADRALMGIQWMTRSGWCLALLFAIIAVWRFEYAG